MSPLELSSVACPVCGLMLPVVLIEMDYGVHPFCAELLALQKLSPEECGTIERPAEEFALNDGPSPSTSSVEREAPRMNESVQPADDAREAL